MQTASSKNWTQAAMFISYDVNHEHLQKTLNNIILCQQNIIIKKK